MTACNYECKRPFPHEQVQIVFKLARQIRQHLLSFDVDEHKRSKAGFPGEKGAEKYYRNVKL